MTKKKTIKVRRGYVAKLAEEFGVTRQLVYNALNWGADTDLQNKVREAARKYEKRF